MTIYLLSLINESPMKTHSFLGAITSLHFIKIKEFVEAVGSFSNTYDDGSGAFKSHFEVIEVEAKVNEYYGNIYTMEDLFNSIDIVTLGNIFFENIPVESIFPNQSDHVHIINDAIYRKVTNLIDMKRIVTIKKLFVPDNDDNPKIKSVSFRRGNVTTFVFARYENGKIGSISTPTRMGISSDDLIGLTRYEVCDTMKDKARALSEKGIDLGEGWNDLSRY